MEEEDLGPTVATTLATLYALKQHLNQSSLRAMRISKCTSRTIAEAPSTPGASISLRTRRAERSQQCSISITNGTPRTAVARAFGPRAPGGTPPSPQIPFIEFWPEAGTLVVFWSADFWHEVRRKRLSLTGWFLRRASNPLEQAL